MDVDLVKVSKISATAFAGMFAGGSLYCNVVQMPALMKVQDTKSLRECWKPTFLIGAKYQPGLSALSMASAGIVAYHNEAGDRYSWMIGIGLLATVMPYTMFIMIPDIKRLLNDSVIAERGESWVRSQIETWGHRHFFRSLLGMGAFGIFLISICKK